MEKRQKAKIQRQKKESLNNFSFFYLFTFYFLLSAVVGCDSLPNIREIQSSKPTATASPNTGSQTSPSNSLNALEKSIDQQVNEYRKSRNLPPLTLDDRISEQAKIHSQAMANGKVPFSHEGFEQRVKAIAKSINYRSSAENVAFNQGFSDPATQAVQGWLKSPGHLKNIEGDFDLTGVGVIKNAQGEFYFTQIFIKRSRYGF